MNDLLSLKFLEGKRTALSIVGFALLAINAVLAGLGLVPFDLSTNPTVLAGLSALGLGGLAGKANGLKALAADLKAEIAALRAQDQASKPPQS